MSHAVRIEVDHDKCVGSRICVAIAPNVFTLDENGQATVADPAGDTLESIHAAAEGCPVSAITVERAK
jgi:ferredoxin